MHIYGKDQQAFHLTRTRGEKWFSRANTIIVAMQIACFLAAIIRTAVSASNSMTNAFFSKSDLQLTAPYLEPDCDYNVTRSHAFFTNVQFQINPGNVGYFVSRGVQNIRYLFAVTGCHAVLSAINRVWFETNTHELRYHFVVFRKDMLTTWEVLLMVMGIVIVLSINTENKILDDYVVYCFPDAYLRRNYYHSVLPYIELYVSYFISLAAFIINALVALYNLLHKNPRDEMIKADRARMEELLQQQQQQQQQNSSASTLPTNNLALSHLPSLHNLESTQSVPVVELPSATTATIKPTAMLSATSYSLPIKEERENAIAHNKPPLLTSQEIQSRSRSNNNKTNNAELTTPALVSDNQMIVGNNSSRSQVNKFKSANMSHNNNNNYNKNTQTYETEEKGEELEKYNTNKPTQKVNHRSPIHAVRRGRHGHSREHKEKKFHYGRPHPSHLTTDESSVLTPDVRERVESEHAELHDDPASHISSSSLLLGEDNHLNLNNKDNNLVQDDQHRPSHLKNKSNNSSGNNSRGSNNNAIMLGRPSGLLLSTNNGLIGNTNNYTYSPPPPPPPPPVAITEPNKGTNTVQNAPQAENAATRTNDATEDTVEL